jgi:hypothetical protein
MVPSDPIYGSLAWRLRCAPTTLENAAFSSERRKELTQKELRSALRAAFQKLRVKDAPPEARKWWRKFAKQHMEKIPEALKICNVILAREGTAEDFYRAFTIGGKGSFDSILDKLQFFVEMRKFFEADDLPDSPPYYDPNGDALD